VKVLVTAKRVPDPETKIKLLPDGTGIVTENLKYVVNPFDEIAIEEGLRIKEAQGGEVVIVSVGGDECKEQIRTGLAMGADRGVLVKTDSPLDSAAVAAALAKVVEKESPDIVIVGKQSVDTDNDQAGQMLAETLGWAQACFAYKIELTDGKATVTREVDGGLEVIEVPLPAVITTDLRLNEPRYASLPGIMKAKKKPIDEMEVGSLGIDTAPKTKIVKMVEPPPRAGAKIVETVEELVDLLKNEAKVL
jgi:electron transfer flavoprotein beta subunit